MYNNVLAKRQYKARKWADFEIRSLIEDGYCIEKVNESERWNIRFTYLKHDNGRRIIVALTATNVSVYSAKGMLKQIEY